MDSSKPKPPPDKPSGRVKFDDRDQAIWEWSVATGKFDLASSTSQRLKKLLPELSIVDDEPPPGAGVRPNPGGVKKGYDPYDSGRLSRTGKQKAIKKDLRKLGDWLDLRRQAAKNKDED